jgi:hypothetical protein
METYVPDEVKQILAMLKTIKRKKNKNGEPTRLEKQIKYLEQRLKFFNPTKEMLGYIINQTEKTKQKLDPVLMQKLKEEYAKKQFD